MCVGEQESAELRLPIDRQELNGAAQQERGGGSLAKAEVTLEMRAQLSTSMPWAPMVREDASQPVHDSGSLALRHIACLTIRH